MQTNFDFTDTIDTLDPVAQAEVVIEYLDKNYTQKQLGEKLGKTRDWIAKRVQFIRALDKLPEAERKEVENLVRHHTISIDVVILIVGLPKEQRWHIFSKCPTIAEARGLIDEYRQHLSPTAKLKVLENGLSEKYIVFERMVGYEIANLAVINDECSGVLSSLHKQCVAFIAEVWDNNYRFGPPVQSDFDGNRAGEMLRQRIAWLELPEKQRLVELQETITHCFSWCQKIVNQLNKSKAAEVPSLMDTVKRLQSELESVPSELKSKLRSVPSELNSEKLNRLMVELERNLAQSELASVQSELEALRRLRDLRSNTGGVTIDPGNGYPSLVLDISSDEELKTLHRTLAVAFHPDKHTDNKEQYEGFMKDTNIWWDRVQSH